MIESYTIPLTGEVIKALLLILRDSGVSVEDLQRLVDTPVGSVDSGKVIVSDENFAVKGFTVLGAGVLETGYVDYLNNTTDVEDEVGNNRAFLFIKNNTICLKKQDGSVVEFSGQLKLVQEFTEQTTIAIEHGWGLYPSVQIIGSDGQEMYGVITNDAQKNRVTIDFTEPQTGTIIIRE